MVATVQSISVESVLGVNDSVKKISLQAKDSLGNNISNIFNNKIFKIGKSSGFVSGYSLFHFPVDTIAFSLVGIENPSLGLSSEDLTPEKIFDFDVGDRFDYEYAYGSEPTYHDYHYEIDVILSKEISVNGDTLTYQVSYKKLVKGNNWSDYFYSVTIGIKPLKIILPLEDFLSTKPFEIFGSLPYQDGPFHYLDTSQYNPPLLVLRNIPYSYYILANDCFSSTTFSLATCDSYAPGLGMVSSDGGDIGMGLWIYNDLVYYNKNGVEWGDSLNWNQLTDLNETSSNSSIRLFPNPTHSRLFLSGNFQPLQTHFTLLNSLGEEMKLNQLSNQSGSVSFDVRDLPEGFYVLRVKKEDEIVNLKFVKE